MSQKLKFSCGCEFPIKVNNQGKIISLDYLPTLDNTKLDCPTTWNLLAGNTKGCFQLESNLGQTLSKKLKPQNIEQLAALTAIMRPGCKEAERDGKTITDHYIDRKNMRESVDYYHKSLEPALKDTLGELIYQEGALKIVQEIAGFDLQQADIFRKAIGKKRPEIMAKVKKDFIEGCKIQKIVNEEEAEEIFGWIEKSQRYSFNKAHAIAYGMNCYLSAYTKSHFELNFFEAYLKWAKEKPKPHEEVRELVQNARRMGIEILPPDFRHLNKECCIVDKKIYFGLEDIKDVGNAILENLDEIIKNVEKKINKNISDWTWTDFLINVSGKIRSDALKSMIACGALDYFNVDRTKMLYEYNLHRNINARESKWLSENTCNISTLEQLFTVMVQHPSGRKGPCSNINRKEKIEGYLSSLKNPPYSLEDDNIWKAGIEETVLGIALTCSVIDGKDTSKANCTCSQYNNGYISEALIIAGKIDRIFETLTKKGTNAGQPMGWLTISDHTDTINSVAVFADIYTKLKNLLIENNTVIITGKRGRDGEIFIAQKIEQI